MIETAKFLADHVREEHLGFGNCALTVLFLTTPEIFALQI
jgi:hypothetical protein